MAHALAQHYPDHVTHVRAAFDRALERSGFDEVLVDAGRPRIAFLDDQDYPFVANPLFAWWLPLTANPWCLVHYVPGNQPTLVYHQPADYWHKTPEAPGGFWADHFDIRTVADAPARGDAVPAATGRRAYLGEWANAADTPASDGVNPAALVASLHEDRTVKSAYELDCMRAASARAMKGHRAAEAAFRAGASEFAIHLAYLAATGHSEAGLPYANIIALNEHCATLHYTVHDREAPEEIRSFLIDAGAAVNGYAADVTRTYAANDDTAFAELLARMEAEQRCLCEGVRAGKDFVELHVEAHHAVARVLSELGIVTLPPDAIVEAGLSSTFLPHGLGHPLGLQVHDVAGHQVDASGARREPPAEHPFLRQTRILAPGNVTTIEPGLYFIDLLLDELRASDNGRHVAWDRIDALRGYGGVRIEDNLVVTADGPPENLTRDAA